MHISMDSYAAGIPDSLVGSRHKLSANDFVPPKTQDWIDSVYEKRRDKAATGNSKLVHCRPTGSAEEILTSPSDKELMKKLLGVLGWLATNNPNYAYPYSQLSQFTNTLTHRHVNGVKKILRIAKTQGVPPLILQSVSDPVIRIFTDASVDLAKKEGRRGMVVLLHDRSWAPNVT